MSFYQRVCLRKFHLFNSWLVLLKFRRLSMHLCSMQRCGSHEALEEVAVTLVGRR